MKKPNTCTNKVVGFLIKSTYQSTSFLCLTYTELGNSNVHHTETASTHDAAKPQKLKYTSSIHVAP